VYLKMVVDDPTTDGESCCSYSLSTHSLHMRSALKDCSELMERLREWLHLKSTDDICYKLVAQDIEQLSLMNNKHHIQQLFHSAWLASGKTEQEREVGLRSLHEKLPELDIVHVDENGWYREGDEDNVSNIRLTPSDFKQKYCFRNVPCIIRGFDELHFKNVSLNWKKTETTITDPTSSESRINTSWFERYVGEDTIVPVRIDGTKTELDEDGRAEECTTKMMSLKDWIASCQQQSRNQEEVSREYLKDWHLVQFLQSKQSSDDDVSSAIPLYKTPEYFERDILNNFLEKYSDGGDYKFCYWGPSGSITRLHSDVLHSFSWSYNVIGSKKWTFYIPNSISGSSNNSDDNTSRSVEVIQNTGETIFVSSKIKHEVVNLVETLSINHNWITSANIDNTWQCICSEIEAIEGEINEWGIVPVDDFEARENMLRGCIGLDVTTFFLMILLEVSEILVLVLPLIDEMTENDSEIYDSVRSIYSLVKVLGEVSNCKEAAQRLEAVLGSKTRAVQADGLATFVMDLSDVLKDPL
jgi:hypothetical protein